MSDSDYSTLLYTAVGLGGVVRAEEVGGDRARKPGPSAEAIGRGGATRRPLSTAHIRPHMAYTKGAEVFKIHRGSDAQAQHTSGIRDEIKGFSRGSRRRLLELVASVRKDAALPLFVTLTYPDQFPTPAQSKIDLATFSKRLRRAFENIGAVWKLEPQERGAPHYHMLVWGVPIGDLYVMVPKAWYEVAGQGDEKHLLWHMGMLGNGNKHCVQRVNSRRGVLAYASKYLGKTFEVAGWAGIWTGRYWGCINQNKIPFGERVEVGISEGEAKTFQRYQRRFSGVRSHGHSLTIFCDADQWAERVIGDAVQNG